MSEALVAQRAVARCADYLAEHADHHPELIVMLLANLTTHEAGAAALLQVDGAEALRGRNMCVCGLAVGSRACQQLNKHTFLVTPTSTWSPPTLACDVQIQPRTPSSRRPAAAAASHRHYQQLQQQSCIANQRPVGSAAGFRGAGV